MSKAVSIGVEDFKKMITNNYYFVDKTLFIKNVIDNADDVCLITRPRRFGKTLNLSMLKYYFDIRMDSKELFKGLKIMNAGDKYTSEMNKYPVIFLTLKNLKDLTFSGSIVTLKYQLAKVFDSYKFLTESDKLNDSEKDFIMRAINKKLEFDELSLALQELSSYIYKYYDKNVIMLIDEYDVPLHQAYVNGFYDEAIGFWYKFFDVSFKSNDYLQKTILTGISRISKENIFSGLNKVAVHSIVDDEDFSEDFGFTEEEVFESLNEYNLLDKKEDVKSWYDGYKVGVTDGLYNPWSILWFLIKKNLRAYWVNTSGNDLVRLVINKNDTIKKTLFSLFDGETVLVNYDENTILNDIEKKASNVWGLLISTGYLKVEEQVSETSIKVSIPNLEVKGLFETIITDWLEEVTNVELNVIARSLVSLDYNEFISKFKTLVNESFSYFDVGDNISENFYHAFMLGLLVSLKDTYYITSNRESGKGRYDILMKPKDKSMPSFILEFKVVDNNRFFEIIDSAKNQVNTQEYDTILKQEGYTNIQKLVFAFQGKDVEIEVF